MLKFSSTKLERIILLAIKVGVFLLFLTPLVLVRSTTFPALIPKAIYFRVLVEIIFFLYVLLLLRNPKYLPKFSLLFIVILIYFEVLGFSTWKSINPERSFWGTMERMEGFINFLHIFAFYLVLVGVFKERRDWINLLRFAVLVSLPVGITGILQRLGVQYFFPDPTDPRISAALGNSVFYGNYLTLVILLAFFLGIVEEKSRLKILFWFIAFYNFVLLVLTATRSAWVGIFFALFFLAFCYLFLVRGKEKERQAVLFGIFIILLFFLLFLLFVKAGILPENYIIDRYYRTWSEVITLKSQRFAVWKLGIAAWKDSPVFGYGLESFSYIYDKYYKSSLLELIPETLFFDRAHNKIVDILVMTGIVGLISYLAIFAVAIFLIFKNWKQQSIPFSSFIFIAFILDHFVQNIASFDTINSYLLLFLVLGFVDFNFRNRKNKDRQESKANSYSISQFIKKKSKINPKIILIGKIVIASLAFYLTFYAIFINIRFASISVKLAKAYHLINNGRMEDGFRLLEAASNGPDFTKLEAYYYSAETIFFAPSVWQDENSRKQFSKEIQKITRPLEEILDKKSEIFQLRGYLMLARIYRSIYLIENDKKYLEDEERVLGKAMELSPEHPAAYRLAGNMRFHQNRKEEGLVLFGKAYELDKNLARFYDGIGMAFIETGEKAKGVENSRKSLRFGDFYTKENFKMKKVWEIAETYEELKDYKNMADFYEEVIEKYPGGKPDPQLFASLSTVYAKIGDKKKARETAYKMLQIYPELKSQAEQFLNNLENIR
jgi:O-antigen ligase/tetratricopeptide (TPR) repeat protein